ncbi:MAG TPA: hypothetical protein VN026_13145 [Bacteroidia bacterium]|jgi:hypothetical protein|nr:hypothetical protein [Bacteroidia bacterium]
MNCLRPNLLNTQFDLTVVERYLDEIFTLPTTKGYINITLNYKWSKDFLEAGKKRLSGDTDRNANASEVQDLKKENDNLKKALADLYLHNDLLKKSLTGLD